MKTLYYRDVCWTTRPSVIRDTDIINITVLMVT